MKPREAAVVAGPPGEAPGLTEPRAVGFPAVAPEPPAPAFTAEAPADHEPLANHEPVAAPTPDLPGSH